MQLSYSDLFGQLPSKQAIISEEFADAVAFWPSFAVRTAYTDLECKKHPILQVVTLRREKSALNSQGDG